MSLSLVTLFLLLLFSVAAVEAQRKGQIPPSLFEKSKQRGHIKNCKGSKGRKCDIDTSGIDIDTADEIEFDDVDSSNKKFKCTRKDISGKAKGKGWYGQCDGENANDLIFVKRDGKLTGSVQLDGESCIFQNDQVECTPLSDLPDEEEFTDDDEGIGGRQLVVQEVQNYIAGFDPSQASRLRGNSRRLYDDSGSTIDVLVVWTKQAECLYTRKGNGPDCGLNQSSYDSMAGLVDLLVEQANVGFANSGVKFTIRLVHAYRHKSYVEESSSATVLNSLSNNGDGKLDDVHAKRTLYGADLVHMIIGTSGCGIAYLGPEKTRGFSVTRYTCAVGQYSFPHELAHNMGAHHDRGTLNKCSETGDTYRYGYRDPKGKFRSIMAYQCVSNQCDNVPVIAGSCQRVLLFSNPTTGYEYFDPATQSKIRRPIGDARNDNVRQLNNQRKLVASWYPAMDCGSNAECDDKDATTIDTCNKVKRVCIFTPKSTLKQEWVPTPAPVPKPVPAPVPIPVPAPVPMPVPVPAPVPAGLMESLVVKSLSDKWSTVSLKGNYTSAIPVCSQQMDKQTSMNNAVVRIRSIGRNSFEIKLQSAAATRKTVQARNVHCIVVEEGKWLLPDGRKTEAWKFLSTATANKNAWNVQSVTYRNLYNTAPAVLGGVISTNDPNWSVFMAQGPGEKSSRPTSTDLKVSKLTGEDYRTRANEMLGIIVVETGHATSLTTEIETARSSSVATGYVDPLRSDNFQQVFRTAPVVIVLSQVGQSGGDGSWAVLRDPPRAHKFSLAVDEDNISDPERNHAAEAVDYMALSVAGVLPLTPA